MPHNIRLFRSSTSRFNYIPRSYSEEEQDIYMELLKLIKVAQTPETNKQIQKLLENPVIQEIAHKVVYRSEPNLLLRTALAKNHEFAAALLLQLPCVFELFCTNGAYSQDIRYKLVRSALVNAALSGIDPTRPNREIITDPLYPNMEKACHAISIELIPHSTKSLG